VRLMYGLKPVPFKFDPVPFKFDPVPFKFDPAPFKFDPVPFKFDPVRFKFDPVRFKFEPVPFKFEPARLVGQTSSGPTKSNCRSFDSVPLTRDSAQDDSSISMLLNAVEIFGMAELHTRMSAHSLSHKFPKRKNETRT